LHFRGFHLQDRPILFSALKPLPPVPPKKKPETDKRLNCGDDCNNLPSSVFRVEMKGEADIGSLTASVHSEATVRRGKTVVWMVIGLAAVTLTLIITIAIIAQQLLSLRRVVEDVVDQRPPVERRKEWVL